jgi:uncharacterized protein (DUF885 family)
MQQAPGGLVVLILVILATVRSAAAEEPQDVKLAAFFKSYLDAAFRLRPLDATRLGDHRFDHLLDDVSAEARGRWARHFKATLDELPRQVDAKKLSRSSQIDYEIFEHDLQRSLWLLENSKTFEEDPRVYNDYLAESVYLPLVQSTLPRPLIVKNSISRIARIPKVVAAAKASLRNPPRVFVETAISQNRGTIAFYKSGIYPLAGETPQLSELQPVAQKALGALEEYQTFLEKELLPRSTGEWRIGKERFYRKLELELDAGLSADQVLAEAEAEFTHVELEMYVLARQLWSAIFPGKALPPDDPAGRTAAIRAVMAHLAHDHGKPENLVADARATVEQIKTFIAAKDILRLPDPDRCQVIEMPEFQRGNTTAFLNPAPPLDKDAASVYAVAPPPREWDARRVETYLQEYNRHMLQLLTIHEAYPGHYVQLEYSNRHPSLVRRVLQSGVFAEGWAVYTEQMMLDQGYGLGDLALRLHQLKWYLRAVANAILDYKMHCTNMSDEEVLAFLTQRAFQSEGEAVAKIVRAKQSSCQLSTYFVGRTAFYRLRQQVQREMGEKFDLGRYHEAVLAHGTLPVKYLPALVRERLGRPR